MGGYWILLIIFASACIVSLAAFIIIYKVCCDYVIDEILFFIFGVFAVLTIIFFINAIVTYGDAQKEYAEFEERSEILELYDEFDDNGKYYDIISEILKYNKWLKEAKKEKNEKGIFSAYFYQDLDKLKPIKIPEYKEKPIKIEDCKGD